MANLDNLTKEEKKTLLDYKRELEKNETQQVMDLVSNCDNKYQFAKTHSVLLEDWEKTKRDMENMLNNNNLPPDTSVNFHKALIEVCDEIITNKLESIRMFFQRKFGESIYNYLSKDGKTKKLFGIFG